MAAGAGARGAVSAGDPALPAAQPTFSHGCGEAGIFCKKLKGCHAGLLLPLLKTLEGAEDIPINIATQHPFEQANIIERIKPDVIIIHTGGNSISAKHGLPLLPLFSPSINYLGYSGEYEMARRLSRIVRNPSLNRHLAKYCPKPFRQSWYEEDPFKYIRES